MIQVLARAHRILVYLRTHDDRPVGVTELARDLGISVQACANIVRTLLELGYVARARHANGYQLGPMAYRLGRGKVFREDLVEVATPIIDDLVKRIGEYCVLVVNHAMQRAVVLARQPERELQVNPGDEQLLELPGTSTGRVMLAYASETDRARYVRKHPLPWPQWPEVSDFDTLERICARIRAEKIYLNVPPGNPEERSVTFAMAVLPFQDEEPECVLGVRMPAFRFREERRSFYLDECRRAVGELESALRSKTFS